MIATVDVSPVTDGLVSYDKPSERLQFVLRPYIAWRLRKEIRENTRGYAARVAEAIDREPATISAIKDEKRGLSEDIVHELAGYWRITVDELNRLADAYVAQQQGESEEETSPKARLFRLIREEVGRRTQVTKEQLERAFSLEAYGGKITQADVRRAFDRKDDEPAVDADYEREHTAKRGKRRRKPR